MSKAGEFIKIVESDNLSLEDLEKLKKKSRDWYADNQQYMDKI
jgi:hypothetical protein